MNEVNPSKGGVSVSLQNLTKRFGQVTAVDALNLDIAEGEFIALLGPSGSGKTTVLMSIAGFEFPSEGTVFIDGQDCTRLHAHKRNLGMVFQSYTLFPHMSVLDNVAFPLKMRGVPRKERSLQAEKALEAVRLAGFGTRKPNQLSGGQQQRVALARAIVYRPRLLLMDESLGALDKNLREEMQLEIKRLHSQLGITIVFVTHDQSEALTMANRVAVLKGGKIQQIGAPDELYERPRNKFTASFIGEMNFVPATIVSGGQSFSLKLEGGEIWEVPLQAAMDDVAVGDEVLAAIRPERVSRGEETSVNPISMQIEEIVYSGPSVQLIGKVGGGSEFRCRRTEAFELTKYRKGEIIRLRCASEAVRLYRRAP